MIEYPVKKIAQVINGEITGSKNNVARNIAIDSRKIVSPADLVFFAIRGINNDGHAYIPSLIQEGIKVFVVNKINENWKNNDISFIRVDNTLNALQLFAAYHRN